MRFSIRAGGRATLLPRLTRAAFAAAGRNQSGVELVVDGHTVDPEGRHNRFRDEVSGHVR